MDTVQAAIDSCRSRPDELYRKTFFIFQDLFRTTEGDVSKIQLPSYLPESVYSDRQALGSVITAALLAMLDRRMKTGGGRLGLGEIPVSIGIVALETMPKVIEQLDDIILGQAATIGGGIFASDLAYSRFLEWQHHDYDKLRRCLRALDKAARIHQRLTPAPLTDPNRKRVKELALKELRPVLDRLQKEFKARRQQPSEEEILKAFEREANNPNLSFLSNGHNLSLWIDFLRIDPLSLLSESAVQLFDHFNAHVTSHKPDYTRRKTSYKT